MKAMILLTAVSLIWGCAPGMNAADAEKGSESRLSREKIAQVLSLDGKPAHEVIMGLLSVFSDSELAMIESLDLALSIQCQNQCHILEKRK